MTFDMFVKCNYIMQCKFLRLLVDITKFIPGRIK